MKSASYVVAGYRPWNAELFEETLSPMPGDWTLIRDQAGLTVELLERLAPRYVFLLHWSWIVPREIWDRWECVGFHMGDLPRDRGGSPLQNLILDGRKETQLNAFRITEEMDAGPIYRRKRLSLDGSAGEIYRRAGDLAAVMIADIVATEPSPVPQEGEPSHFRRRRSDESALPTNLTLAGTYDFIRMLDADGYPHAFLDVGPWRLEFRDASLDEGSLRARVRFRKREEPE